MAVDRGHRVRRGSAPGLLRDAAREVFAERGYRATTREIAARAGVSHDRIFRHFETKEKLLFESVVAPMLDAVGNVHRNWLADPGLRTLGVEEVVRRFTAELYGFYSSNRAITSALTHLFTEGSSDGEAERVRKTISEALAPMVSEFDDYLAAHGMRRAAYLQLRMLMLFVGSTAVFLPHFFAIDEAQPSEADIVEELTRFIYGGLILA